jgi:hypothetical protein
MRAKTVQRVRGGRLLKGVNDEPFFYPPIANESVLRKKHITENHAQNKNMLDINLLRPEKGGDPVRFVATTFNIPLSLLVVFVDVFLCSSSFRRRLRRAMMIGDDF